MRLSADIFLSDIMKTYPEVLDVFIANGFGNFENNDAYTEISPFIRLKTILKTRNINEEYFMSLLNEKINTKPINITGLSVNDKMSLLALLPCPLKLPLQEAFEEFLQNGKIKKPKNFSYLIEGNANNQLSYYSYVDNFNDIDEIPDVIISPGINSFYYKRFVEKFIDKGLFVDAAEYEPKGVLSNIGIKDPGSNYTIVSMNLLVMVVDKLKIGNTPIPQKWEDLLKPEFENRVAIRGQNDFFCETTLLTIYKQFGIEGIRKLGKAVKYGWHPSQMAKAAGSSSEESPAVSVMPHFFTRTIKYKQNVEVVWPEDGAIVSPVTMLVKAEKADRLKDVTRFFTGTYAGKISASASFPVLHPDVDNKIPQNASFNWLGWDFIKQNDIEGLISKLNSEFLVTFREK